jgi:hypothetical protein
MECGGRSRSWRWECVFATSPEAASDGSRAPIADLPVGRWTRQRLQSAGWPADRRPTVLRQSSGVR